MMKVAAVMIKCVSFFVTGFFLLISLCANANDDWKKKSENPEYLHRSVKQVTDVMVHDIYSPPVASRIYAYVTIAAYEAAFHSDAGYISLSGQLHGLDNLPHPLKEREYSYSLASVNALLLVAKSLIISEEKITAFQAGILNEIKASGMPQEVFDNSVEYGKKIAEHILEWASKDRYKETRSLSKYAVDKYAATWKPTPPGFMKAIEPHWGELRTFLVDSAQQFKPARPTEFSIDENSRFFKEAKDVHDIGLKLTPEQIEIANFWDCNPFKMNINGHVMYATKKISPGGHWVNITGDACKKVNAGLVQSAEAYACLCITLADGFISCWDEKYRSKVIRPETYINQYISQSWVPLLQTPPFPEYTSGHSVVSAASAVILSKLFGNNFSYSDSTEVEFEIPVRKFTSFKQAAEEAAISRFYGGIHYMPSIKNGLQEGNDLGVFIAQKLRTRKSRSMNNEQGIFLADPAVFNQKGNYYLYGTVEGNAGNGFKVYTSKDMEHWKIDTLMHDGFALKKDDVFGTANFWAPQVFQLKDSFYMAYVANENIAIAVSASPAGPFKQVVKKQLDAPVKQIDPFLFIDDDGKKYLYHVRLTNGNKIFVAQMEDDLSAIKPATLKECITATAPWENTANSQWPVTEGPSVIKHNGLYYLFYTANDFRNPDYAVGYATSRSPYGPWEKFAGNPIISKKNIGINGTGHGDFVRDEQHQLIYVFHTHFSDKEPKPRRTATIKVSFVKDQQTGIDRLQVDEKSFRFITLENKP